MRRDIPHLSIAALGVVLLALGACTDRNPAGAGTAPAPEPPAAMAMLTCTASVTDGTLACGPQTRVTAPGVSAAIIGGQDQHVRLASTGASYDGTSTFRIDVTLENLTNQALGTTDGTTPAPEGVRVFISSGPVATGGTGPVEVANADGEAFFTAAAQKYFQYDGILPTSDTTAAREWRFTVPPSVSTFTFGVYVAAPIRAERGFLLMQPIAPSVGVGGTIQLTGQLVDLEGLTTEWPRVAWSSSNPAVATVDSLGMVTGVAPGSATITAVLPRDTGSVRVVVYGPGGTTVKSILVLGVEKGSIVANGADSLQFFSVSTFASGVSSTWEVHLRNAAGGERVCRALGGGPYCSFALPEGSLGGTWRIERMLSGNRTMTHAELVAAGVQAHVYVRSPNEDRTAPTLDSLALAPATVADSGTLVQLTVVSTDPLLGPDRAEAWVSSPGNPQMAWDHRRSSSAGNTRTFVFEERVPGYFHAGTFTLDSVRVRDNNGNRRTLNTAALAARGWPTQFTVTGGTTPDTVPPTITGFGFSPDTVVGNGADPVTVTFSASEPAGASGVWFMDMEFEKVSDPTQLRRCLVNGTTRVSERTMTCSRTFDAADVGAWRVRYIRAIDFMNNARELNTAQLTAAGYATSLVVTGTTPDATPPVITAFSFSPQTVVGNGADSVTVSLSSSEPAGESGLWYMDVVFEKVSDTTQRRRCELYDPSRPYAHTLTCRQAFAAADAGEWRVRYVRAIDVMYNSRVLFTAALQEAGYPIGLTVTSP
jgi:Bacterial Ig-like domain (group 2)